jgi:predicted dehydrogenase
MSTSRRRKWLILGTSFISMAKAIQDSSSGMIAAVGGRNQEKLQAFAEKFAISKFDTDYDKLINDPEVEAVYIGLPNHLHKEYIIRCAKAGKHILSEKPFVISVAEADEVKEVLAKANVFCLEALMYRYHSFITRLRQMLAHNSIGDIHLFEATYNADIVNIANKVEGGAIRNLGCYPISLVRMLAGSEPLLSDITGTLNPQTKADTTASVTLTFPDGKKAFIKTSDSMQKAWQFTIHGSKGQIKLLTNPWMPVQGICQLAVVSNSGHVIFEKVDDSKPLYSHQIDLLGSAMASGKMDSVLNMTIEDSCNNVKVLESWREQVIQLNLRATHAPEEKALSRPVATFFPS